MAARSGLCSKVASDLDKQEAIAGETMVENLSCEKAEASHAGLLGKLPGNPGEQSRLRGELVSGSGLTTLRAKAL